MIRAFAFASLIALAGCQSYDTVPAIAYDDQYCRSVSQTQDQLYGCMAQRASEREAQQQRQAAALRNFGQQMQRQSQPQPAMQTTNCVRTYAGMSCTTF